MSATYARTVIELLKKSITAIEAIDQKPVTDYTGAADGAAADPLAGVELPNLPEMPEPPDLSDLPDLGVPTSQDKRDPMLSETRVFETDLSAQAPAAAGEEKPHFKFENLKFGKDYHTEDE